MVTFALLKRNQNLLNDFYIHQKEIWPKQQDSKELRFKIHFYKSSFKPWVRYKNLMLKL